MVYHLRLNDNGQSFILIIIFHNIPLTKKVASKGNFLTEIADFSVVCQPAILHIWLKCGIFLLLPNLPAYELAEMSDF